MFKLVLKIELYKCHEEIIELNHYLDQEEYLVENASKSENLSWVYLCSLANDLGAIVKLNYIGYVENLEWSNKVNHGHKYSSLVNKPVFHQSSGALVYLLIVKSI